MRMELELEPLLSGLVHPILSCFAASKPQLLVALELALLLLLQLQQLAGPISFALQAVWRHLCQPWMVFLQVLSTGNY